MEHIFLTGAIQVGKSTLIRRALGAFPGLTPGGFRTLTGPGEPGSFGGVYMVPAAQEPPVFSEKNLVGMRRGHGRGSEGFPAAFDACGTEILQNAEQSPLILMDEIGKMEAEAFGFCRRVEALLDGDTPILGVVRLRDDTPLQRAVRRHPKVRLLTVTEENRDALLPELTEILAGLLR